MNETVFREILGESLKREFAEFDNAPEHKFSLKHRLAMKRIFARYEKNTRGTIILSADTMPRYRLKQKIIIALIIVILMTLITGWFIPLHRITEAQIDWLRSRYDFTNMKMYISESFTSQNTDPNYMPIGAWRTNDDYLNFLSDLETLGIYTAEETHDLRFKSEPLDIRPDSFDTEHPIVTRIIKLDMNDVTPIDSAREFVSNLENKMDFYAERSKDKSRALEGDAEFAANIRDNYLTLHKSYLQLLEKLFAVRSSDGDSPEIKSNILYILDKDDRRYLFKINELEEC